MSQPPIISSTKRAPAMQEEPISDRLRRVLLMGAWITGIVVLVVIWAGQIQALSVWGLVEGLPAPVASLNGGQLSEILVAVGDRVEKGAPVARLNDAGVRMRLLNAETAIKTAEALAKAELSALDSEHSVTLSEGAAQIQRDVQDQIDSRSRIASAQQELRMKQAELEQELQASKIEADIVDAELTRRLDLATRGLLGHDELVELRQRQAYLSSLLKVGPQRSTLLTDALATMDAINRSQSAQPVLPLDDMLEQHRMRTLKSHNDEKKALALQHETAIHLLKVEHAAIQEEMKSLTLMSPVKGIVSIVLLPAGSVAPAGAPVLQVVPSPAERVLAWVGEKQTNFIKIGGEVTVIPAGLGASSIKGRIIATGAAVDAVPTSVRMNYSSADRGLPVLITLEGGAVMPGERVQIRFGGAPWWAALPW